MSRIYKYVFAACAILLLALSGQAYAQQQGGTIKLGIMHSLTGTMAISEQSLKDVMLMLINEQNNKGGVLGRKLEAVVVDPASSIPRYKDLTKELLLQHHVAAIFGCWTSASRKAILPILEEYNGLLFYPVQYEGEEAARNIIYTGATPSQQAIPAVEYLIDHYGIERFVLLGTDYIYPRTINRIISNFLMEKNFTEQDIMLSFMPFGFDTWAETVTEIKEFGTAGKKTAIISTLNGDSNISFYKELATQNVNSELMPVMAFSVNEEELTFMDTRPLVGHLAAWNYFMSVETPENALFIRNFRSFLRNRKRVTADPLEAHYIGFNLWVKAVEKAGSTDVDKVLESIIGLEVPNLSGTTARVLRNHHITKPVLIGEITDNGQFDIVWQSDKPVAGEAWSNYLEGSKDMRADWVKGCSKYSMMWNRCLDEEDEQ